MVATWLTELYLDQINRALLDTHAGVDAPDASPVEQLEQQLQVSRLVCQLQRVTACHMCMGICLYA